MKRIYTDYLGDVQGAMQRYDDLGPGVAEINIDSNDLHDGRYGVRLSNLFGRWEASEETLADSIHRAIDRGIIDRFGFNEDEWQRLSGRAGARAIVRKAEQETESP